ncbi:MAG TPA: nickel pincer cofactor biosynthesis protein LarB [Kiritimatiellia bacterium]|jgi:NCAIR mutase (PurE)-related protein|nr:MAG: N5-carboxyaminoimidazole ribonucleotide mutase [Verrucomicrobia bacterium ADurb.Bin070]HPB11992.1 nickel pincer cofactor biosynthesis protein LarB [Kiritimatiellia bacterium]HPO38998.1 nickel pincer cofactor biosynthesis protein LarB [Kiritimatiellia bacterium]HQL49828.1 nickel pincer cofactor biosynthesis protein LarB [Kiritimatiellia bacterium]HQQ90300.1 nickel pincer cofactor biosynthesis protein LarB [Kiritimatiellia bacterium]
MTDDLHFAKPDYARQQRCGVPEVIYGAGKTASQIVAIMRALNDAGQNAFATRVTPEQAAAVRAELPDAVYRAEARILTRDVIPLPPRTGKIAVLCAGTSDLPVAEEAAVTAERLGATVERVYDVGVAGLHRLLSRVERFADACAIIVVAGMEGALPSVVGGLIDKPVIAVPTSVGYGASFNGLAALLGMLNTCAAGVTVVNIDNGFGAGVAAARINHGATAS